MDPSDPRLLLARRLKALREEPWPDIRITQPQLAQALGKGKPMSAALISSWESQTNPAIPPLPHLHAYAALFATRRSFGQVADWSVQGGQFFEVDGDPGAAQHHPVLENTGDREVLMEDVALFARTVNPFNRARTATICSGMYGRGTYGVVRALTDPEFLERNSRYLESRFSNSPSYCLVVRVTVDNSKTITPDWTDDRTRLFEWSGSVGDR